MAKQNFRQKTFQVNTGAGKMQNKNKFLFGDKERLE